MPVFDDCSDGWLCQGGVESEHSGSRFVTLAAAQKSVGWSVASKPTGCDTNGYV